MEIQKIKEMLIEAQRLDDLGLSKEAKAIDRKVIKIAQNIDYRTDSENEDFEQQSAKERQQLADEISTMRADPKYKNVDWDSVYSRIGLDQSGQTNQPIQQQQVEGQVAGNVEATFSGLVQSGNQFLQQINQIQDVNFLKRYVDSWVAQANEILPLASPEQKEQINTIKNTMIYFVKQKEQQPGTVIA